MSNEQNTRFSIAVIGAGPAGLFAARELATRGMYVALFNRDIKPGGLAEYGIYPSKTRMKEGLRNQFRQILAHENIDYYGNVLIGQQPNAAFSLDDLRILGFQAILVTVGAQSTKRLGIPGEDLSGVYHAKDIVYHYNLLPPFSESTYHIRKRVAVVGVGNVMVDIARWLINDKKVESVTAVARRGPVEVKFDRKELESIVNYIDPAGLDAELARVLPTMQAIGQTPEELLKMIREVAAKAPAAENDAQFYLRFLSSPARLVGDESGQVKGLEVEENTLLLSEDGETRAVGTGKYATVDVDTVIFAIGDVVEERFGLPVERGEFAKSPSPRFPIEGISYEAFDPKTGETIPDVFLAGWARRPSAGLVGIARKDGTNAAQAVSEYLDGISAGCAETPQRLRERLASLTQPIIDKPALLRLEGIERDHAKSLNLETYKFSSNQEMLENLGLLSTREVKEK